MASRTYVVTIDLGTDFGTGDTWTTRVSLDPRKMPRSLRKASHNGIARLIALDRVYNENNMSEWGLDATKFKVASVVALRDC